MNSPKLLWFKNDLRLNDNESLHRAIYSGSEVVPVYCFDPKSYHQISLGFPKSDNLRFQFLVQSLTNLKENLMTIGGNLKILIGNPSEEICKLAIELGCSKIFTEEEFADEELRNIDLLKELLPAHCSLEFVWGRTLYHKDDIPYAIANIPLTSKAFRINTTKSAKVRRTFRAPLSMRTLKMKDWGRMPTLGDLGLTISANEELYLAGGETEALARLNNYLFETELLTSYRWTRNRSLGMDYSSKFSPYMALGCLSPRTIYESVQRYEEEVTKNASTWWMIFEIIWRDYFTFKLMRFSNKVFRTEGYSNKTIAFKNNQDLFGRWCHGKTGIPFVDAHMRQLNHTGYMSNRGRVNCSSFLIHDYKIDWTWGASYFESKLIDYDVASNWMNWHAQAYQIWYTNPVNQANKYSAQEYIKEWIPELAKMNDLQILIPWEYDVPTYPQPIEIFSKWNRAINKIKKDHGTL